MENSAFSIIRQIYSATSTPIAVADENYNILWKNSAAESCAFFDTDFFPELSSEKTKEGIKTVSIDGSSHIFNIMKCAVDEKILIAEYLGKKPALDISVMQNYFTFLCARIRESASQISMSADDIDIFIKNGDTNIASPLNKIDNNVMLLLKEAVIPETIFYASDKYCDDCSINLAHETASAIKDLESVLNRGTDIWQNAEDSICADINKNVFETVLAQMTAVVCCGELYPDRLEYIISRENETRGSVSVRSISISAEKNKPSKLEHLMQSEFFTDTALKQILAQKYGISFRKTTHSDGIEYTMFLDILPSNKSIVKSRTPIIDNINRFSSMAIALSEKHHGERYKNIKIN